MLKLKLTHVKGDPLNSNINSHYTHQTAHVHVQATMHYTIVYTGSPTDVVLVGVVTHRTALHVSEDLKHVHLPLCLAPVLVDVTAEGGEGGGEVEGGEYTQKQYHIVWCLVRILNATGC